MSPILEKIGLYENIHFLTIDIENIERDIDYIQNLDINDALSIAENAFNVINNNHRVENRLVIIDKIIKDSFYDVYIPNYTNFKMILNDTNTDWISKNINNYKSWEPNVTNLLLNIVNDNNISLFCDVGCNLGYYYLLLSPYVNKVNSFDILYSQIENLNISISKNKYYNIESFLLGISNKKGISLIILIVVVIVYRMKLQIIIIIM